MSKIEKTSNYELFDVIGENRPIDMTHVKHLAKSISKQNLLDSNPILVNENLEVIDGQHRLKAAELLGVPIYYIINRSLTLDSMAMLNDIQKKWDYPTYISHYAARGFPDYIELKEFLKVHQVPIGLATKLYSFNHKKIKSGEYKHFSKALEEKFVVDINNAKLIVMDILDRSFDPYKKQMVVTEKFYRPLRSFIAREEVDFAYFRKNCNMLMHLIVPKSNAEQYYNLFLYIYNFNKKNKLDD